MYYIYYASVDTDLRSQPNQPVARYLATTVKELIISEVLARLMMSQMIIVSLLMPLASNSKNMSKREGQVRGERWKKSPQSSSPCCVRRRVEKLLTPVTQQIMILPRTYSSLYTRYMTKNKKIKIIVFYCVKTLVME